MKKTQTHEAWLADTQSFYDRLSGFYDAMSDHYEKPSREKALELFKASEGERVLEIGFGTGHCLVALAQAVGKTGTVLGIDVSMGMARQARKRVRKAEMQGRAALIQGDALALPLRDGCVSGIVMSFALELFPDHRMRGVLSECERVLERKGRLVAASLSKAQGPNLAVSLYEWFHKRFPHFIDCEPIMVGQSLETAGFIVQEQTFDAVWKLPVEVVMARKR